MSPNVSVRQQAKVQRSPSGSTEAESPVASLRLHIICVVLALTAAYIFTLTEHDDHQHTFWCMFEIAVQTLLVIVATVYFRMRIRLLHDSSVLMPVLVMIVCLSLICEPIQRLIFNTGHSFEMLIMHSQCNLMLALAVCGFRLSFQRLSVIIAVFMTIFCCTVSNANGLIPLTIIVGLTVLVWLIASWWESIDRRLLRTNESQTPKWGLAAAALVPMLVVTSLGAFGSNSVTTALSGFMPSSGGSGDFDPFSRGGIKDGDALIAGNENIKSFAPLEDAPFMDSDKPSLYDVFNDTFDEPPKKRKKQQRAIALPPDLLKHIHQQMAKAKQAGREFSLLRSDSKRDKSRIRDLDTHALLYVAGRTPLHLKTEVYDLFDGTEWAPSSGERMEGITTSQLDDQHWLNIPQFGKGFEIFDGTAAHSLKSANLDGNTIPSPAHPIGISINLVNRADMYVVRDNGMIELDRKSIPSMTPINFVSRCVSRDALVANRHRPTAVRTAVKTVADLCFYLPEGQDMEKVGKLAEQITEGIPRGWMQMQAIETYLRKQCTLDRSVKLSDSDSPVADFLFERKAGPEYLFASSAVVMLRSLGYSARLVSGFYARPERYDSTKQHTPIMAEDAHVWCEASIGAGCWLTLEPSPGYHVLQPEAGFFKMILNSLYSAAAFVVDHAIIVVAALLFATLAFRQRFTIQELLLTLRWKLYSGAPSKNRALQLATLVDHRMRLAGLGRKAGTTLRRWSVRDEFQTVAEPLNRVADIADLAAFCPINQPDIDSAELDQLAKRLNFRTFKQLGKDARQQKNTSHAA